MNKYELLAYEETMEWVRKYQKRSSLVKRISKKAQDKINKKIPEQIQDVMTDSIKNIVKMTMVGSSFTTKTYSFKNEGLSEREALLKERLEFYRKTATIEGAGTGAGGFLLGLADFPLLLTIKMKFLFEAAAIYGYDTKDDRERIFILYVFTLAFSSDEKKREALYIVENWNRNKDKLSDINWEHFQQEYRDYIDFVKMFQLVPGIGAVVGAYANYNLLDHLGEVAKHAYRLRIFNTTPNADI